jgi:ABC-type sugar transport system substrate-binding protein
VRGSIFRSKTKSPGAQTVHRSDAALALAAGKPVEKKVYIPFQLVTPANMDQFMKKN